MQYLGGESMNSCTTRHCNRLFNEMGTTKSMRRQLPGLYRACGLTNRAPLRQSSQGALCCESHQLWQSAAHKDGSCIGTETARPDKQHHVLTRLELRLQF